MAASTVHCFTSASLAYADRALVLAHSLRRQHPDWVIWLCLVDRPPEGFALDPLTAAFDHIVPAEALPIADMRGWLFGHDVVEACTAVKGAMLRHMLDQGADRVLYLDPDIAVFAPLTALAEQLDTADVLLTPHVLVPESTAAGVLDNEIGALKHGIYNLGFIGVSGRDEGRRFARWWDERLQVHCIDDIPAGLFTDQRWCDHVPVFFPGTQIVRDPGYNVASWNVANRPLSIGTDGVIRAAGVPLRFFHFTKFTGIGRLMLERQGGTASALAEVMAWYADALAAQAPVGLPAGWWAYGHYADGRPIPREHRRRWRADDALRARIADPFALTFRQAAELTRSA
ncbi:hypothetical protein AncyloWKF20_11370 [Ancylobacter sp. WKF20]|uniref:hypothetical protein n=1 Tax=Ancylobacter sp. WKF20 TaxID=3039801 RepID=UPI002434151B|nr:hypothetical protein [Ancylobacter sp. WKF20]WGD28420.1 hypothetical protein AncyloWKF20_11370 [Ancylobacter sp. WKF20]